MKTMRLILGGAAFLSFQALPGAATAATCLVSEYPCADVFLSDATAQGPLRSLPPTIVPDPEEETTSSGSDSINSGDSSGSSGESEGGEPEE